MNATRNGFIPAQCAADGCARYAHARGYCNMHYIRVRKHGSTELPPKPGLYERFFANIEPTGFCWEWRAYRDASGYGRFMVDRSPRMAHRVCYEALVGPIPEGLQLDHLCRNPACVNPDHLEPVTPEENSLRGFAPKIVSSRTKVCVNGHSTEDAYLRPDGKGRQCRTCIKIQTERAAAKRREGYASRPVRVLECVVCGSSMTPLRSDAKYCSSRCRDIAYFARKAAANV